jgi:hypothetical protein
LFNRTLAFKNALISPLKLVILPLVGKNENTVVAPFGPENKFHVCPAKLMLEATGTGWPEELYEDEMGPAF